jgi:hypothetical protein
MDTRPCVFCGKDLESAVDNWETMQPHGGGEVRFVFAYGSTKFDNAINRTEFSGVVCDGCGAQWVHRMQERRYGWNGELLDGKAFDRGA